MSTPSDDYLARDHAADLRERRTEARDLFAAVFTDPRIKPDAEAAENESYQKYLDDMVQYCRCRDSNRPCDGVLAGGICDDIQDEPPHWEDDGYED